MTINQLNQIKPTVKLISNELASCNQTGTLEIAELFIEVHSWKNHRTIAGAAPFLGIPCTWVWA